MKKRIKLSKRRSRRLFKKGATVTNTRNISGRPMRGGIRL